MDFTCLAVQCNQKVCFPLVFNYLIISFSRCTNTFSVPANTPISIFIQFEEIPNVAGGSSCTNSKLVFSSSASGSNRELTTCNTDNNGHLVRYLGETSAYTLTISFTPSSLESGGRGYLLLLSTCKQYIFRYHNLLFIKTCCRVG